MNVYEIIREYPDNKALRTYACQLRREAMERWVDSASHPDRRNHIACIRADILHFACELLEQVKELKSLHEPQVQTLNPPVVTMLTLYEEQVSIEIRTLQVYLDLLDAAEALVVDSAETQATANSWVSGIDQLVREGRVHTAAAHSLRTVRSVLDGFSRLRA